MRDTAIWREKARHAAIAAALDAGWPLMSVGMEKVRIAPRKFEMRPKMVAVDPIRWAGKYIMAFVVPDHRERDHDNAVASGKPLTDGIVEAGILAGDSTRYIDSEQRRTYFRYHPGENAVLVYIEEAEPPQEQLSLL